MSSRKYAIYDLAGNLQYYLNPRLVEQKGVTEEGLRELKQLHQKRVAILQQMADTLPEHTVMLHALGEAVTQIDYSLQRVWGFPMDKNFHRFWEVPWCSCPALDNEDAYPTGYYVVNKSCPVHGEY